MYNISVIRTIHFISDTLDLCSQPINVLPNTLELRIQFSCELAIEESADARQTSEICILG